MSEDPPDLVRGTYSTDLNINKIHDAILTRFKYFIDSIDTLKQQVANLIENACDNTKPDNEIKMIYLQVDKLKIKIHDYENKISYTKYIKQVTPLLEKYNKVASNDSKGVIFFIKNKEKEEEDIINYRLRIIRDYLELSKDYIRLELNQKFNSKVACMGCELDLTNIFVDEDSGLSVCPSCGYEKESISHNSNYKDTLRVNSNNRNNYDDCENFRKALYRFQGKQNNRPPVKLYEQLDLYFIRIKKFPGSEIIKLPITEDGKKKGTSREMMFEALADTNNSAFYDDINLILHVYWGWELPNISHLEERIMEDYINTQQIYNSIAKKDRNASLNIQFRLYVHLKSVGYPCSKDDFKIQTSRDSLIFHNEIWREMCEKTGIKFHPVI
jgi:hypothetical protein